MVKQNVKQMAKHPALTTVLSALGQYVNPITGHKPLNLYRIEDGVFIIRSDYWERPTSPEIQHLKGTFASVESVEIDQDEDCGTLYGLFCQL